MSAYDDVDRQSWDYQRIEKAIRFIEADFTSQPTLDQMAESVHLSKYHLAITRRGRCQVPFSSSGIVLGAIYLGTHGARVRPD